jgi:hypothetical protein
MNWMSWTNMYIMVRWSFLILRMFDGDYSICYDMIGFSIWYIHVELSEYPLTATYPVLLTYSPTSYPIFPFPIILSYRLILCYSPQCNRNNRQTYLTEWRRLRWWRGWRHHHGNYTQLNLYLCRIWQIWCLFNMSYSPVKALSVLREVI